MTSSSAYELALQLHRQGRLEEAAALYRQVLLEAPGSCEAHFNLGTVLHVQGRAAEAEAEYEKAIELKPDYAAAHNNLGNIYHDRGQLDQAMKSYRLAVAYDSLYADPWNNLGMALNDQENFTEAAECFRQAIDLKPNYAEAHSNLGMALQELESFEEAVEHCKRAVQLDPGFAASHNNLGTALWHQSLFDEAESCFRKALALNPNYAAAFNNLGTLLKDTERLAEADSAYQRALALNPDYADAHSNYGIFLLMMGRFEQGWQEYEWRWKCRPLSSVRFLGPRWEGQHAAGKTILLRAEQGFGDTFQFIRYATLVSGLEARVVFSCPSVLRRLVERCPGVDQVCEDDGVAPQFDFEIPLMSLPMIFGTTLRTIPADVPYLFADGALVAKWKAELADVAGFRVGVNWRGRTSAGHHRKRDVPIELLEELGQIPGIRLLGLQRGAHQELSEASRRRIWLPNADFDTANGAFMDTAAIIMNLDLVITSDTSIAHLAGALGKPVWVMLPFLPSWHWMLRRTDSPWYPTMRLFRQGRAGDWRGVFEEVRIALSDLAAENGKQPPGQCRLD